MRTEQRDIFSIIDFLKTELQPMIDVESIHIDFSTQKDGESSIGVTVFYFSNVEEYKNFTEHFFRVNENPASLNQILYKLKARVTEINNKAEKTVFTTKI